MNKKQIAALAEITPILTPYTRPTYIPQMSKKSFKNTERTSKYFGNPYLEKDELWPQLLDKPAMFILQLDIATLPENVKSILGNSGLLQFFFQEDMSTFDFEDLSKVSLLRIVHPTDGNENTAQPTPTSPYFGIKKQKVIESWLEKPDLPHHEEYPLLNVYEKVEEILDLHDVDGGDFNNIAYQGDKLSGWPYWYQGAEYPKDSQGEDMIYVYQIDMGCFFDGKKVKAYAKELFADSGTGHIFVSKNNPQELKFTWAC